jgi:hypothetical protein
MSNPSTGTLRSMQMTTQSKPYTIEDLSQAIYQDNLEHFEYMSVMYAGDCDCRLCSTLGVIQEYRGE